MRARGNRAGAAPFALDAAAAHAQVRVAMADVDAELAERVARWCAEAGRQAGAAHIRRALAPLGWDDLLAVRALLADPPPARPLGPFALVDIARGTPPDLAAEREREGRYRSEEEQADAAGGAEPPAPAAPPAAPRRKRGEKRRRREIVIHRARDRAAPVPVAAPSAPEPARLEDLRRPEGRAVLERLIRRQGARRAALARALAGGWRKDDGTEPGEDDVSALLEHHGLARAFARRERDELLHALRAAGGFRPAAAERLALDVEGLEAALVRAGGSKEAARIREERRAELRGRATLAGRVRLLLEDEPRLRDLEILDEFEADLRSRLPEHVRALRLGSGPLAEAFARSLSLERADAARIALRLGIELGAERPEAPPRGQRGGAGRPELRPRGAAARPGGRGGARPGGGGGGPRPGGRVGPHPSGGVGLRPGGRAGPRAGGGAGPRPGGRTGPRPGGRAGSRAGGGAGSRPGGAGRGGGKPGRPGARPRGGPRPGR